MVRLSKLIFRSGLRQTPNMLAALIAVVSFAFLSINLQSQPADASMSKLAPVASLDLVPTPPASSDQETTGGGRQQAPEGEASGRMALLMHVLMLEKGEAVLARVPAYSATFAKQELVAGSLLDEQVMQLKVRHEPFSVYMKWSTVHKGRQVLYVAGENKGKLLVKFGGWKKRLPALKLDPDGSTAMAESRYPISKAGLLELVRETLVIRHGDLKKTEGIRCRLIEDHEFDGRPCFAFVIEYSDRKASPRYRKCEMLIDRELGVPVMVRNFGWSEQADESKDLDAETLVELYTYRDIAFQREIVQGDFDRRNKAYRF